MGQRKPRSGVVPAARLRRVLGLGICTVVVLACFHKDAHTGTIAFVGQPPLPQTRTYRTQRQASGTVVDKIKNPVKTVADTLDTFWKEYPKPPVLPMYKSFIIDFVTQLHLAVVNAQFKYDAIFALGVNEYFTALMGNYDKLIGSGESEKIWSAMMKSLDLDGAKVKAGAAAMTTYAKDTGAAGILAHIEGGTGAPAEAQEAFTSIRSSLYSLPFSLGLFKVMQLAGAELSKETVEEWAKVLQIPVGKATSDLETYRQNKNRLQQAEELLREVEIREKKKLAQRLEEKAKKLQEAAAKAAGDS